MQDPQFRSRLHHRRTTTAPVLLAAIAAAVPAAAQSVDCSVHPGDPSCSLGYTLHILYWIAGVLALLLILILALAIAVYRKTKNTDLRPHD